MPRLQGTEQWSDEDISSTVNFFLGCAANATALRQELSPVRPSEVRVELQPASPMELFSKAIGLLLATDRVEQALKLLRSPLRLIRTISLPGNRYDVSVAEFTRIAIFSALSRAGAMRVDPEVFEIATEAGYFDLVRRQEWHYEMLAVLPVLYTCALALRSGPETIRDLVRILATEEDSSGAFVMTESLEFRALGIFQMTDGNQVYRIPALASPIDALIAVQQMESRYEQRLQSYRQDRYHWDLLNTEGDLIDWPLLVAEIAAFRVGIDPGLPFVSETSGGAFIRALALELRAPTASSQ